MKKSVLSVTRTLLAVMLIFGWLLSAAPSTTVKADPFPPAWPAGAHYPPVSWPSNATWRPYTYNASKLADQRITDPSNGGTSPQNYVNVSSSCNDTMQPSVYYQYDEAAQVFFFRWRVEQIANTYATGPSAGSYSSSDPWKSAQWTVLFDTDGDGYREFAVRLQGSSGSPSTPIDVLESLYSDEPSQSVDYLGNPNIHLLQHNPTAFVDTATNRLLNFHNSNSPDTIWPNGSAETVWDYGTTRATNSSGICTEYLIDYQIPLGMLDATAYGGPKITADTPLSFAFATANSLTDPLQKDIVFTGDFNADANNVLPVGDTMTTAGGTIPQPVVQSLTSGTCSGGLTTLTTRVSDVVNADGTTSVADVNFYAYHDANANGVTDDGGTWTLAASATTGDAPVGTWSANWNVASLLKGRYLVGVQATDAVGNTTYSYLTAAEVISEVGATPPNYANPAPTPGIVTTTFVNTCGVVPPYVTKAATPAAVSVTQPITFTITVHNPTASAITANGIEDVLPPGFSYAGTSTGGTFGTPATSPSPGATGTLAWTFPDITVPPGGMRTLVFQATAASVTGTYSNVATASTSTGLLTSDPVEVSVGAPRLSISKVADVTSANPGETINYTITYANDSPVNISAARITDTLPVGLTYVGGSASGGGSYDATARTLSWNVAKLTPSSGASSVSFQVTVDNPYPTTAAIPAVNTATITSAQTEPAIASASVYINSPRPALRIQKSANVAQVAPGGAVSYRIELANSGNGTVSNVQITDAIPAGFTFVGAPAGAGAAAGVSGTLAGGIVTWNIGSVAPGATGSVTLNLAASSPYTGSNPSSNTAQVTATDMPAVQDTTLVSTHKTLALPTPRTTCVVLPIMSGRPARR